MGCAHDKKRMTSDDLRKAIEAEVQDVLKFVVESAESEGVSFRSVEKGLRSRVFDIARLCLMLFVSIFEERITLSLPSRVEEKGSTFQKRPAQPRNLNTSFGIIRYWRTYMRGDDGHGFHPTDQKLGLTADRMSLQLLAVAARLATKLSFEQARDVLGWFVPQPPSTAVIEETVLGFGVYASAWFDFAPAPPGDGEVLVLQFDSKAAPTATETELKRRRGTRRVNPHPGSKRHRGRERRLRYGPKPRRKKGDKSKNGKMATLVIMYTLKKLGDALVGPINQRIYASFAPKRHAFEVARREATKRGFGPGSGRTVQIVTDGDDDLAIYVKEYFPEATHTIDVYHVMEYIWKAGKCIYREGSKMLSEWVRAKEKLLYGGKACVIISELRNHLEKIPSTGPGNKGKRNRLSKVINFLSQRVEKLNYKQLRKMDLELGSGAVEGAIKHVVGARFDHGGMRWIRERAEALLQLRCIEKNGDWDEFMDWIHDRFKETIRTDEFKNRILQEKPAALPKLAKAA
jgi:hypothetical protein